MPFPILKAPFPWFGGKSRVSSIVWDHFGDVRNYVEPFAGSLAVLLGRRTEPKIETVNDLDCWIANFWRAVIADPAAVAAHADWPVNEADLHARHLWLVKQADFRERMKTDPDYCDCKIAGWWVWGISQWIGSGWCSERYQPRGKGLRSDGTPQEKIPHIARIDLGFNVSRQLPELSGDAGAAGRGIHASGLSRQIPADHQTQTGVARQSSDGIYAWFDALSTRLRRVRVCCGDWQRILGPAPTTCIGTTGVFLDPPYAVEERADVYNEESRDVAHDVREWAIANGDNPELRIALCGYEGEHAMPDSWTEIRWKANGGFGNQGSETVGRANAHRERIWFSPHCITKQANLFAVNG